MKACPLPSPGFRKVEAAVGYAPAARFWAQNEDGTDAPYKSWEGAPSTVFNKVSKAYGELAGIKARIVAEMEWMKDWKQQQVPIRKGVEELFESNPELANIGTQEQYSQYLGTIFPNSKVKDIVYRGKTEVQTNQKSKELGIFFTDDKNAANIYAVKYKGDEFYDSIIQGIVNKYGLNPTIEQVKSEISFFEKMGATKEQIEKDAKEFQNYILNNKGISEQAIINIKTPKNLTVKDWFDNYENSSKLKGNSDGLLLKGGKQTDNRIYDAGENQIVVFEPEQIHILGSKQDIEGFKEFMVVEESGEPHIVGTDNLSFYNGSEYLSVLEVDTGEIVGEDPDTAVVTSPNHFAAELDMFSPVIPEISQTSETKPDETNKLLGAVKTFLDRVGVRVNTVDKIVNKHGEVVAGATGRAAIQKVGDEVRRTIDLVMGKANKNTVNEETAHIFVGMLPVSSPLYQSMYKKVTEYDIYREISENPEAFGVTNEQEIREEAMGRIIADHMQEVPRQSPDLKKWTVSWFEKALSFVKKHLLGKIESDPFARSAYQILTGDTTGLQEGRETELFNIEPIQTTIVNAVRASNRRFVIKEIDNQELLKKKKRAPLSFDKTTPRYVDTTTGEVVTSRVTDTATLEWRRNMGNRLEDFEKDPNNKVASDVGTALHDFAMQMGEHLANNGPIPKTNSIVTPEVATAIKFRMEQLIEEIREYQNDLDPNGKPEFLFEHTIYDPSKDIGGSIDLLVIFSDGSASIYDHKFMANIQTVGFGMNMAFSNDAQVTELKIRGFDQQIATYKKILKAHYGISTFRKTRILPGAVKLKEGYTQKSSPSVKYNDINWVREPKIILFSYGDSKLTREIPVAGETTGNQKIDKLLTSFMTLRDNLINQRKQVKFGSAAYERLSGRIEQLANAIRGIQRDQSVSSLIRDAWGLITTLDKIIGIEDSNDPNYMTNAELIDAQDSVDLYIHSMSVIQDMMKEYKSKDPELFKSQKDQLKVILEKAILVKTSLIEMQANRIEDATGVDVTAPAEEMGWWGRNMSSLFQMSQPVFRAFSKLIKNSIGATKRKVFEAAQKIEKAQKNLIEWGKQNGKTGLAIYDDLYNKETGNLYSEFSDLFYQQRTAARKEKNYKWMVDNYAQTAEDRARFLRDKKARFEIIDKRYKDEADTAGNLISMEWKRAQLKKFWVSQNDLSLSPQGVPLYPDAWVQNYIYASVKDRSKWQSDKYKYIQSVPALKEFYDMYIAFNEEFREFLPEKVSRNFVANVRKDAIDVIADQGLGAVAGLGNSFLESFQVIEEDKDFGMTDPFTGNITPAVPTRFTRPIFNSEGKIDLDNKSKDLSRNLLMFANMAYNYKHMAEIEHMGLMMRHYIQSNEYQEMVTDAFGNVKYDSNTGNLKVKQGSPATVEAFNSWLNFYVYGQTSQGGDLLIGKGDKKYSGRKILKGAMKFLSAKALSLNFISATANISAAASMGYMEGVKGVHYTTEQYRRGFKRAVSKDEKVIAAFEYLQIAQEEFSYLKSTQLSASKAVQAFTFDKLFILHRKGDDLIDFVITSAILESKGFDSEGNIVDADGKNVKSIYESMELKNDKWENLTNLPQDQFVALRNYIRYVASTTKGNMSSENVSAQKAHILYQTMMHFRSWLPRLAEERFSKLRFNPDIEKYEVGRYRAFFDQFTQETFLPGIKNFVKNLTALRLSKVKADPSLMKIMLANAKEKNPSLDITLEEFTKLIEGQTRALAVELRIILTTFLPFLVSGLMASDDDEKDELYVRQLMKAINRTNSELTFFISPKSFKEIGSAPFPVMSLATDVYNLVANTADQARDDVFGQNSKQDKTGRFYYTGKIFPGLYGILRTLDVFEQQR
jgi:hypothetical protein